jgi:alpha/beta superfamily hydrolase
MHNNVVVGVRNYLVKQGYSCITFNFRGVGKSTGAIGNGSQEIEDMKAIYKYTKNKSEYKHILVVGYSYGGLISLAAAPGMKELDGMCLISYPSGFVKHLRPVYTISFPLLFIHGERDSLIPPSRVQKILPNFTCRTSFKLISTDHFYNGKEKQVGFFIQKFIEDLQFR